MESTGESGERLEPFVAENIDFTKIRSMLIQTKSVLNLLIQEEQKKADALMRSRQGK